MKIPRINLESAGRVQPGRRQFLKYLVAGACLAPVVEASSRILARRDSSASLCAPSNSGLLTANDFAYLGYYDVQLMGLSSAYAQALTHRYVGNELRFLTIENGQPTAVLREWSVAGRNFGDTIINSTGAWDNPWGNDQSLNGYFFGLWWEEERNRLWSTHAFDYTYEIRRTQVFTRTLNSNGTVSNVHGPVGLSGISAKRAYGGAQAVPAWFQARYGVGPYVIGWGGYTSIVAGGGIASLGPTMYAIKDPAQYSGDTDIPLSEFKVLMDSSSGTVGTDWYASGSPTFDRGVRLSRPINYYDFGDSRQNPTTAPSGPPSPGAQWLSPAPDGLGRFVWGDSYYNTGCWIDSPAKQGFIAIANLGAGKTWYGNSTLNCDSRVFELHIFDPVDLGAAALRQRPVWAVKPASLMPISLPGLGGREVQGNSPLFGVGGATYDPISKKLFVFAPAGGGTTTNRLYVYSVNA